MDRILAWPTRAPGLVISLTILVTILAGTVLAWAGIGMDANMVPLAESHSSVVAYRKLKDDFTGTGEIALIHLRHPRTVFNTATLERIARLTHALESVSLWNPEDARLLSDLAPVLDGEARTLAREILVDGIGPEDDFALSELQVLAEEPEAPPELAESLDEIALRRQPVRKVTGLANAEYITAKGDSLEVGRLYDDAPKTAEALKSLREEVLSTELFRDLLISGDERSTGMIVETDIDAARSELVTLFQRKVEKLLGEIPGEEEAYITGVPVIAAAGIELINQDNERLFPVIIVIVLVVLYATFRSLRGVVLPLAVVVISLVWLMAVMAALGVPLNNITSSMPVFLITIGVADGIHLISEFRDHFLRLGHRREAVVATVKHMALPVAMTSLTTAAGFLALAVTDIKNIREFGLLVALGAMFAMVVSLTFIPAMLTLGKDRPAGQGARGDVAKMAGMDFRIVGWLAMASRVAHRRAGLVLLIGLVLVAGGLVGMTRVVAENDFITYYADDHPIVIATARQDKYLAGSNLANLLVTASPDQGAEPFRNPELLALAEGLQRHVEQQPMVGKTLSLVDVLKRINRVMHGDDPAYDRLPEAEEWVTTGGANGQSARWEKVPGRNLVSQYLVLYENGGGDGLSDVVDSEFRVLNIGAFLNTRSTMAVSELIATVDEYAAKHFPPGLTVQLAGAAELAATSNNEVVAGQVRSLTLSLAAVFLLLLVQFRSLAKALLGVVPLVFAVIFNFGIMGWGGINLNMGTAIVSSVVIGIGVDFAIHYLTRLQLELERNSDVAGAVEATMVSTGKAITSNAVVVSLGFMALLLANMVPLQQAGFMLTQLLLVSAAATLLFLPAAVSIFRPRFARKG